MRAKPSFPEFVVIIALLMAVVSLSIDNLLPAFDDIHKSLHIADINQVQLIITVYMTFFAVMQLVYGPLSDRYGRKPVLLSGLFIYTAGTVIAIAAQDFETLLLGRAIQGAGAASARVLSMAIIRDCYSGRDMARVMSITMVVFIIIPVLAPGSGALLMLFGGWRLIFISVLALSFAALVWTSLRLPETWQPMPGTAKQSLQGNLRRLATTSEFTSYAMTLGLMMGCLMCYLGLAPLMFDTGVYHLGSGFLIVFGLVALSMGGASFLNSLLVRKLGMHRLIKIGLGGFAAAASLLMIEALAWNGRPPLVLFVASLCTIHFVLSLMVPNLNALAMQKVGYIAGTAASALGFFTSLAGALIGYMFGAAFNGTVLPLVACYFAGALLCLIVLRRDLKKPSINSEAPQGARLNPAQSKT